MTALSKKSRALPDSVKMGLKNLDNLIELLLTDEHSGVLIFCNSKANRVWGKGVRFEQDDDSVRRTSGTKSYFGKGGKEIMKIDFSEFIEPQREELEKKLRKEKWQ